MNSSDATSGSAEIAASEGCNGTESQVEIGGGLWVYGINDAHWAYSNYFHRSQEHGTSVEGSWFADSGWKNPGSWASAGCVRNVLGPTHAHWRTR